MAAKVKDIHANGCPRCQHEHSPCLIRTLPLIAQVLRRLRWRAGSERNLRELMWSRSPVAIVACLPSTCLLRSRGIFRKWPRLLEEEQCGRGLVVMFLRIPRGSVLLQKFEQLEESFLDK